MIDMAIGARPMRTPLDAARPHLALVRASLTTATKYAWCAQRRHLFALPRQILAV